MLIGNKDYSGRKTWMEEKGWKKAEKGSPCGKLMELVDLDEPTSFLAMKISDALNVKMFESRISAGAAEKLLGWEKPHAKTVSGPVTWKVMLKSALKDIVSWRIKRRSNCTKFQPLAWMITTSSRRNWSHSENFIRCMFSNGLEMFVLGSNRPDILWSGNKLGSSREVEHWFSSVGCARDKHQCLTVLQKRKLFH